MKYKLCNIRINVTKYGVTFATKEVLTPPWLHHWNLHLVCWN